MTKSVKFNFLRDHQFVEFQQNIEEFETRNIAIIGLSRDSAESYRDFISKQGLHDVTLLTDRKGKIAKISGADHVILPVSRRVYIIIDKNMNILYREDRGFGLPENQTETLTGVIDRVIQ